MNAMEEVAVISDLVRLIVPCKKSERLRILAFLVSRETDGVADVLYRLSQLERRTVDAEPSPSTGLGGGKP